MKPSKIYSLLLIIVIILLCMPSPLLARAKETFEETHPLNRDGKVYLKNVSGDIVVNSWDKNEIKIHAIKTARRKKALDNVLIDITRTNDNIRIVAQDERTFKKFRSSRVTIDYELYIPDNVHFKAETTSGDVEIGDIGGFLELKTVSGDISITTVKDGVKCKTVSGDIYMIKINGNVDIKTTSGDIEIEAIKGSVEAETVSGDIKIGAIKGSVEAETVSGDIDLEGFSQAKEIEIETISGYIAIQGFLSPDGTYYLDSHSGKIKVAIPSDSVFELQTKTFSGEIECDFELKVSGKIDRKKIQGVVGKGGANLNLSTFSGNIQISKR